MLTLKNRMHARWTVVFLACSLAIMVAAGAGTTPELPDPGNAPMSRQQQEQLGLQAAAEVYKQMPVLPDSTPETKYIQSLGKRLAKTIPPDRSWPFQFHVLADKDINAFALPGGPMFVNIGTIAAADNEAELAGVMGHEMAHVYMQHSAKQAQKSSLLGGLAGIAGAITGSSLGGIWGTLAQAGIQFGAGTLMLKYSRGDESQADAAGAIILWKAGYDPVALADFFQKIEAKGGSGPQFLSDHPDPGNRKQAIQREIAEWPERKYSGDSAQFAKVRKEAEGVHAYSAQEIADGAKSGRWAAENRKNGARLPNAPAESGQPNATVPAAPLSAVLPSGRFEQASLGMITMSRPENWGVTQDPKSGSVTIAPQAGVSNGAIAYGVVIQALQSPNLNMNAHDLTAAVAQNLEQNDANMKQQGDLQQIAVNGASAGSVELETISPMPGANGKPQPERDWLVAVPRGQGRAAFLVFVAPQDQFEKMKPTFDRMLRSIQFTSGS